MADVSELRPKPEPPMKPSDLSREIVALLEKYKHLSIKDVTVTRAAHLEQQGWAVEVTTRYALYPEIA